MNAIDQWEQEEAALQMEILRKENEAFAALPAEERARIIKEGRDRLEAFAEVAESDEDDEESSDD
jgi:hypothetical protein